jgi:hypothetical protein
MSDLRTMLHQAAGPEGATAAQHVDADLARARLAARRQRLTRTGAGTALVAAVALGVSAVVNPSLLPGHTSSTSVTAAGTEPVRLVAYTGEQAVGFTLDQVPAGWQVDRVDKDVLGLVPDEAARLTDPTRALTPAEKQKQRADAQRAPAPSEDEGYSFVGKVVVSLTTAQFVPDGRGTPVTVQGRPAKIVGMLYDHETDSARTLFVKQPNGTYLTIQVWSGLRWTDRDTVRLANGVHVTDKAGVGVG